MDGPERTGFRIIPASQGRLSEASIRQWNELATATGAPPFVRPGWILPWARAYGSGELGMYTIGNRDGVEAMIPLVARRWLLTSPTNWETPFFAPLGQSSDAIERLMQAVVAHAPRRLDLRFMELDGAGFGACVRVARTAGRRVLTRVVMRSPYIELSGGWDAYQSGRLSRNRRRQIKRMTRGLQSRGEVSFQVSDGSEGVDHLLDEGFRVEASGWKGERLTAIRSRPEMEHFYRAIARWAAEQGWLRLIFLRLDDRAVAFDLVIEEGGVHYLLKTGFDAQYSRHYPGLVLRHEMIKRCFEQGLKSYEFLGHAMPWKLAWTDTCHERGVVQAFRASPGGVTEWAAFRWGRPAFQRGLALVDSRRGGKTQLATDAALD